MLNQSTLILNQDYSPICIVNCKKALILLFLDKVEMVKQYDKALTDSRGREHPIPAVVRFPKYIRQRKMGIKFSKKSIFTRDNHTCAYCGKQFSSDKLTYDHIKPKSRFTNKAEATTWTNIITACLRCNNTKGNRTPEEAKMPLRMSAYKPSVKQLHLYKGMEAKVFQALCPEEWKEFIF